VVVPDAVTSEGEILPCSQDITASWLRRLGSVGRVRGGSIVGVDAPILGVDDKRELRAASGANAVDMESHIAARFARSRELPFAALRVISDGADRALPALAGRAMRPDGSVDVSLVLIGIARDPGQIVPLIATARDAAVAFRVLSRVRGLLGPRLGFDL
jgi:nucleoside phosphorylase